nr:unnamed protein product [Callosobruchus analis]
MWNGMQRHPILICSESKALHSGRDVVRGSLAGDKCIIGRNDIVDPARLITVQLPQVELNSSWAEHFKGAVEVTAVKRERRTYFITKLSNCQNSKAIWSIMRELAMNKAKTTSLPDNLSNVDEINKHFINSIPVLHPDDELVRNRHIRNKFSHVNLPIAISNEIIERKTTLKNLGLILDDNLRLSDHIKHKLQSAYLCLKTIYQNRQYLLMSMKKMLCDSLLIAITILSILTMSESQNFGGWACFK